MQERVFQGLLLPPSDIVLGLTSVLTKAKKKWVILMSRRRKAQAVKREECEGENNPWQMRKREWGCAEGVSVMTCSIGLPYCMLLSFLIPTLVNVKGASECCKWVTSSSCGLSTRLVGWLTQERQEASSWKRNEGNQLNSSSPIKGNFSNPVNETQTSLSLEHSSAYDLSLCAGAFQGF